MRTDTRSLFSFCLRSFLISSFFISAVTPIDAAAVFFSDAGNTAESEAIAARKSMSTYSWNLSDDDLPLISLPDQIGGGIDLSLTYSLDQFEFPLFQSLYYNERAGKYILMVIPKDTRRDQPGNGPELPARRAEFIDLYSGSGRDQFAANNNASLQLTDSGRVKLLSAKDGTVYRFATLTDGELHCSEIDDRAGVVIKLKYANDASLRTIADGAGRTVTFGYTKDFVSSITQTWGPGTGRLRKTWAIADEVRFAHRPATNATYVAPAAAALVKRIPSNAIKPTYAPEMAQSDAELAKLFGGLGAVAAANSFEPAGLASRYPLYRGDLISDDGKILRGHLSFAMHLYGSSDGSGETGVYVPVGFTSHSKEPGPTDAVVTFYYPRLGNFTDVTLAVFHVANFRLSYEGERVRIGSIGGPGGSIASYRHSHLEFYHGNTGLPPLGMRADLRIDPAAVFSKTN